MLAALLLVPLALTGRAEAFIYWTSFSDIRRADIGRAELDGSDAGFGGLDGSIQARPRQGGREVA